ncbi:MAG TPA: hypothetical protein VMW24_11735 [Sedimentisphaerales bacterium]|nr:hypothetical protein [Sedimentisphaerales bacterium]
MGSQQDRAASFNWKWHYSAAGSLIWLALILVLLVPKANHNPHVLWILVPLVVVNLAWLAFKKLSGMPSSSASQFDTVFHSAAVGVAALWLVASYFRRFGGFVRFLMCFGTLVTVGCLSILSYSIEFSRETPLFLALLFLLALALLGAITLSRRLCGGKYRPVRFMLWLALWILLGSSVALVGFIIVGSMIMSGGPRFSEAILILVVGGSILGLCLYVLNLPFMILGFAHPFFRERFCACLGLKSVPGDLAKPRAETGSQP